MITKMDDLLGQLVLNDGYVTHRYGRDDEHRGVYVGPPEDVVEGTPDPNDRVAAKVWEAFVRHQRRGTVRVLHDTGLRHTGVLYREYLVSWEAL